MKFDIGCQRVMVNKKPGFLYESIYGSISRALLMPRAVWRQTTIFAATKMQFSAGYKLVNGIF